MESTYFMERAMEQAILAFEKDEVPVGAVIVCEGRIIGRGYNQTEHLRDVTAHAEMIAMSAACEFLGSKYLEECTLYVTLEPCVMCAGALRWAQIGKMVYGAADDKYGFMKYGKDILHPKTKLEYGLMEEDAKVLLQRFFKAKRK
ncbi:MAG: nucleoside deaminase [Saprospiraceae bacterium]|nr:nucleoside deaminase [Saprospiraceae bacterium]